MIPLLTVLAAGFYVGLEGMGQLLLWWEAQS